MYFAGNRCNALYTFLLTYWRSHNCLLKKIKAIQLKNCLISLLEVLPSLIFVKLWYIKADTIFADSRVALYVNSTHCCVSSITPVYCCRILLPWMQCAFWTWSQHCLATRIPITFTFIRWKPAPSFFPGTIPHWAQPIVAHITKLLSLGRGSTGTRNFLRKSKKGAIFTAFVARVRRRNVESWQKTRYARYVFKKTVLNAPQVYGIWIIKIKFVLIWLLDCQILHSGQALCFTQSIFNLSADLLRTSRCNSRKFNRSMWDCACEQVVWRHGSWANRNEENHYTVRSYRRRQGDLSLDHQDDPHCFCLNYSSAALCKESQGHEKSLNLRKTCRRRYWQIHENNKWKWSKMSEPVRNKSLIIWRVKNRINECLLSL